MSLILPLVISKTKGIKCYFIPGLEIYLAGVKNVKIDFDEDGEGKFLKIRPYNDANVRSYALSELL